MCVCVSLIWSARCRAEKRSSFFPIISANLVIKCDAACIFCFYGRYVATSPESLVQLNNKAADDVIVRAVVYFCEETVIYTGAAAFLR